MTTDVSGAREREAERMASHEDEPFVFGTSHMGGAGAGGPFDDEGWPQSLESCLLGTIAFAAVCALLVLMMWVLTR